MTDTEKKTPTRRRKVGAKSPSEPMSIKDCRALLGGLRLNVQATLAHGRKEEEGPAWDRLARSVDRRFEHVSSLLTELEALL